MAEYTCTALNPLIEDVTLTMIVRDEIINPAGGLLPVLELQTPYYPEVVIVDTGSVDGTRELLEHLSGSFLDKANITGLSQEECHKNK